MNYHILFYMLDTMYIVINLTLTIMPILRCELLQLRPKSHVGNPANGKEKIVKLGRGHF